MTSTMANQREQVLTAIRLTVESNSGVPLGEKSFYRETGRTLNDLFCAGFPNYGSAVEAAGFQRNQLTQAFTDDQLFEPLAELVRRLRDFPTWRELRVARKQTPAFPSTDTYIRRAKKEPLDSALLNWCRNHESFADVVSILESRHRVTTSDSIGRTKQKKVINGYVYLMRYGAHGKDYKIGHSENVPRRHAQIENMIPGDLRFVHVIKTDDPKGIENYWKNRFADRRVRGKNEIFRLTPDDITAFMSRDYQ